MNYDEFKQQIAEETKRLDGLFVGFQENYPTMFSNMDRSRFELPKGWVGIVTEFAQKFSKEFPTVGITQIKQKFGTLRIYTDPIFTFSDTESANAHACISECEEKSYNICENCGTEGATKDDRGFIQTLCEKCRNERN